jgi:hypothetical protein
MIDIYRSWKGLNVIDCYVPKINHGLHLNTAITGWLHGNLDNKENVLVVAT